MSSNTNDDDSTSIICSVICECRDRLVEELSCDTVTQVLHTNGFITPEEYKAIKREKNKIARTMQLLRSLEKSRWSHYYYTVSLSTSHYFFFLYFINLWSLMNHQKWWGFRRTHPTLETRWDSTTLMDHAWILTCKIPKDPSESDAYLSGSPYVTLFAYAINDKNIGTKTIFILTSQQKVLTIST